MRQQRTRAERFRDVRIAARFRGLAIIARRGLRQITDEAAIESVVDEVIAAHAGIVAELRAGKDKAFNALVGKAMAATKGKANPAQLTAVIRRKLGR